MRTLKSRGQAIHVDPRTKVFSGYVVRAIQAAATGNNCEELERSQDLRIERERAGVYSQQSSDLQTSVLIPGDVLLYEWARLAEQRALTTSTAGFSWIRPSPHTRALRQPLIFPKLGVVPLSFAGMKADEPVITTAITTATRAENPGSDMSLADPVVAKRSLVAKTLQAATSASRQYVFSAGSSADDGLQPFIDDMIGELLFEAERQALNGSGSSNEATGVRITSNITVPSTGADGGNLTRTIVVTDKETLGLAKVDTSRLRIATTHKAIRKAETLITLAGTTADYVGGAMADIPTFGTTALPTNLTKGTSSGVCSSAIIGDWSQVIFAIFGSGSVEVLIDPYTKKLQNMIELTAWLYFDVAVRQTAAFLIRNDLTTT
jgi:hypothetical protein